MRLDWTKELWFALLFISVGFTIWPLVIYYLGLAMRLDFFLDVSLRTWAEKMVYGPLGEIKFSFLRSIAFLFVPYFVFTIIRILLHLSKDIR